jgi:hypothetical protein
VIAGQMAEIAKQGWTRPDILAAFGSLEVVGVTDSVVYRAQREKVHTVELPIFDLLFKAIAEGKVQPRVKSKKAKVSDVADMAYAAAAILAEAGDVSKTKVDDLRNLVTRLAEALPEPKADEPEDEHAGEEAIEAAVEAGEQDGAQSDA